MKLWWTARKGCCVCIHFYACTCIGHRGGKKTTSLTFNRLFHSEAAAKVMVELLGSYTEDNASQARVDAHR